MRLLQQTIMCGWIELSFYMLNGLSKMLPGCYCINISSKLNKREGINKIFLKICNYVRYYHLVDGNITVLEQYISKVALMSQNIYGTPVFFNFSLVQNYIMSYFHCNTIFEVYRRLKIFISWLPLMYSRL